MPLRFKTIEQFAAESGYTPRAIRTKISRAVWMQDCVWRRAPDGRILIDVAGYEEWVLNGNGLASSHSQARRSKSASRTRVSNAANVSGFGPPPLI